MLDLPDAAKLMSLSKNHFQLLRASPMAKQQIIRAAIADCDLPHLATLQSQATDTDTFIRSLLSFVGDVRRKARLGPRLMRFKCFKTTAGFDDYPNEQF